MPRWILHYDRLGPHAPIFIRRGDLKKVMGHFHENSSFGSHDKPLLVCRGLLITYGKPTMNSEEEFIVATPAILIRGGELEKVMKHSYKSRSERNWQLC
jgi:hypothetical protein